MPFTHSLSLTLPHSLTHSLFLSFTLSLTHSLTHPPPQTSCHFPFMCTQNMSPAWSHICPIAPSLCPSLGPLCVGKHSRSAQHQYGAHFLHACFLEVVAGTSQLMAAALEVFLFIDNQLSENRKTKLIHPHRGHFIVSDNFRRKLLCLKLLKPATTLKIKNTMLADMNVNTSRGRTVSGRRKEALCLCNRGIVCMVPCDSP